MVVRTFCYELPSKLCGQWLLCKHLSLTQSVDGFQVDFANKYLGGGVLGNGCVQEEIRFLVCPEMILSRLFTEVLSARESLVMIGKTSSSSASSSVRTNMQCQSHGAKEEPEEKLTSFLN